MAHEMIEEGKLLKMSHSVLHDLPLATVRGNSDTSSDNLMASKRSSESQLQGDIKRQKTYELEASEEQKNIQAASEFWAVMRHTHGFQNQAAGPRVQTAAANEVTPSIEPGTSSRQQAEAFLESQGNPKRRRGSDDEYTNPTNHSLDTIITRSKRSKEFTGEYANPITTATPHVDTQTSGSRDAASLTTNEAEKSVLAENALTSSVHVQTPTPTHYGVLVGRETVALTLIEGHFTTTPHTTVTSKKKKQSGTKTLKHRI
jgi:hypothetical protein